MTTQISEPNYKSSEEDLKEALELMSGLNFREEYSLCDGYESWTSTRNNLDAFVELIKRARKNNEK